METKPTLREYLDQQGFTKEQSTHYKSRKRKEYYGEEPNRDEMKAVNLYAFLRIRYLREYDPEKYEEVMKRRSYKDTKFRKKRIELYNIEMGEKIRNQGIDNVKAEKKDFFVKHGFGEALRNLHCSASRKYRLKRKGEKAVLTREEKDACNTYQNIVYKYKDHVIKGLI